MFQYKCTNRQNLDRCDFCDSKGYRWSNTQKEEVKLCPHDKSTNIVENYVQQKVGEKMSPTAVQADRKKRSSQHFQETVYEGLQGAERKHFAKSKNIKE